MMNYAVIFLRDTVSENCTVRVSGKLDNALNPRCPKMIGSESFKVIPQRYSQGNRGNALRLLVNFNLYSRLLVAEYKLNMAQKY